jgi:hypothetical protein
MSPVTVMQDNKSGIIMMELGYSTSERTRHIKTRYCFIQDRINAGDTVLQYLPTEAMIADILTKPLQGGVSRELQASLLNYVDR